MKHKILITTIIVCSMFSQILARTNSPAEPTRAQAANNSQVLPIKRVILYSNGVAYIERRGIITGNAEVDLSFKQSQVDDVLKSMVVLDLGSGRIGAVSYNSSAPPSARMAEIPFSVAAQTRDSGGISGVLAQLQGAKVSVTSAQGVATGSILTVEQREIKTEKSTVTATFLVIAAESGEITNFDMADVRSVKLLDEGTRRDVNEFASATASARRRDAKTITVTSEGTGEREMIVSYTIAAPIWKTTYRVVLDAAGKPFFQGWAIVDNVSDEDWQNVRLSLVSGSPISFIQPIQKPFYRYRPVVPIPQDLQLTPQVYEPQSGIVNVQDASIGTNFGQSSQGLISGSQGAENTFVTDGQEATNFRTGALNANSNISIESRTRISDALSNETGGVRTAATGGEIGDLFEYKIEQPVTVMRDRSALIPIVQTKMDGERVSVYNQSVRMDRPLSGLRLNNTTDLTLESGSITVIDGDAYAGEALMERLKAREQRLISFAVDLGTHVRVREHADRLPARLVKVVDGVFQVHYFRTEEKTYQISNQTDRPKVLYIEHLIRDGWDLTDKTEKPEYTTQRYYRFRIELKPFEEKEFIVAEKQGLMDTYALTQLTQTDLSLFVSRRYIDDGTRSKLEKLITIRSRINQISSTLENFDDEIENISNDQGRLRENIEVLSKTPEARSLITRYIDKVNQQETRLEQIEAERKKLQGEMSTLQTELAREIRNFEI